MKKKSVLLKSALFVALFFAVGRFCHTQTAGFSPHKIVAPPGLYPAQPLSPLSAAEQDAVNSLLNQPFYFMDHGGQCYAFLSADGQTVLKFFKCHHIRFWDWLQRLDCPHFLETWRQKVVAQNLHRSPEVFESCALAYRDFRERTGLVYLHFGGTLGKTVTVFDKLGIAHAIDLDTAAFALQKRVEPAHSLLTTLVRENRLDEAKICLDSILALTVERCKKGIRDRDPNMRTNIGFIEATAIEIDLGSYTKDVSLQTQDAFKAEILNNTEKFSAWLEVTNHELGLYFDAEVQAIIGFYGQVSHDRSR